MFSLKNILLQPYPFDAQQLTPQRKLLRSLSEGGFITIFLLVFQPFGLNNWHTPKKVFYLIGFGLITAASSLILRFVITPSFPKFFQEDQWTVGREIVSILVLLTIIAFGNFVYVYVTFGGSLSVANFLVSFVTVVIIGTFPVAFGVISNYIYQLKKYKSPVVVQHHKKAETPSVITLTAENGKDTLTCVQDDLYFIESADNYAVVHVARNGKLQKEILRSSLSRLETQLPADTVVRCHRSFIVNLDKVEHVTGNAQGYKFHLQGPEFVVPVARKYSELVGRIS